MLPRDVGVLARTVAHEHHGVPSGAREAGRRLCLSRRRRTLLANDTQTRKEPGMQKSGGHQASKATTPQLTTWLPLLPPGIQTDEIECHRTDHLLYMHGWLSSTAGLSASHPTNRLRNTGFDSTAQAIVESKPVFRRRF